MAFSLLKYGMIIIGSLFLFFSLVPIRNIAVQLKKRSLKLKWNILAVLILFFISGYYFYLYDYWASYKVDDSVDLYVPTIFFLGGFFVLVVGNLASQTAKDLRRISLLEHTCNTDSLMQINNRRYFDKRLREEVSLALRYEVPLSLLLIDVDHFKIINDTKGHLIGDRVLRSLAESIKDAARETDIISRYGGEEIAIIAPNTNVEHAKVLGERLRKIVEESVIALSCSESEEMKITISIGISVFNSQSIIKSEDLIIEADNALYIAKEAGRNKVVIYEKKHRHKI